MSDATESPPTEPQLEINTEPEEVAAEVEQPPAAPDVTPEVAPAELSIEERIAKAKAEGRAEALKATEARIAEERKAAAAAERERLVKEAAEAERVAALSAEEKLAEAKLAAEQARREKAEAEEAAAEQKAALETHAKILEGLNKSGARLHDDEDLAALAMAKLNEQVQAGADVGQAIADLRKTKPHLFGGEAGRAKGTTGNQSVGRSLGSRPPAQTTDSAFRWDEAKWASFRRENRIPQ